MNYKTTIQLFFTQENVTAAKILCSGYSPHTILAGSYSTINCYLGTVVASTSQTDKQNTPNGIRCNKHLNELSSKLL